MEKFVLIADDDEAIRKLMEAVVQSEGLLAATVKDGKEAYRALRSGTNIVAAIVDVKMPYIEGTDIVKFIRSEKDLEHIPVIITTGDKSPRASAQAIAAGAVAFLPKPFTNMQLRTALRALISQGPGDQGRIS